MSAAIFSINIISDAQGGLSFVPDASYIYDIDAEEGGYAAVKQMEFIGPEGDWVAVIEEETNDFKTEIVSSLDQGQAWPKHKTLTWSGGPIHNSAIAGVQLACKTDAYECTGFFYQEGGYYDSVLFKLSVDSDSQLQISNERIVENFNTSYEFLDAAFMTSNSKIEAYFLYLDEFDDF